MIDPAIYTKLEEETQLIAHVVHAKLLSLILTTLVVGHWFVQPEWEWEGFPTRVKAGPWWVHIDKECIDRGKSQETPWNLVYPERQNATLNPFSLVTTNSPTENRFVDVLSCTCRQGYWVNQPYGKWLGGPYKNPVDMCVCRVGDQQKHRGFILIQNVGGPQFRPINPGFPHPRGPLKSFSLIK